MVRKSLQLCFFAFLLFFYKEGFSQGSASLGGDSCLVEEEVDVLSGDSLRAFTLPNEERLIEARWMIYGLFGIVVTAFAIGLGLIYFYYEDSELGKSQISTPVLRKEGITRYRRSRDSDIDDDLL